MKLLYRQYCYYSRGYTLGCLDRGLQLKNLIADLNKPLNGPYFLIAKIEYSEQLGTNLHPPLKILYKIGEMKRL